MNQFIRILTAGFIFTAISACNNSKVLKNIPVSEVNLAAVTNGIYQGSYKLNLPFGYFVANASAVVDVSVSNNRFLSFKIINPPEVIVSNTNMGISQMLDQIIQEQKLNVESVSGASYSKIAIQKAIENAFSNNLVK